MQTTSAALGGRLGFSALKEGIQVMATPRTHSSADSQKKNYTHPTVTEGGRVEELTRWVGGRWGEFFGGQGSGWNPWTNPGGGS